jgi:c-di-GMP-related signal transduction protein
MPSSIFGHVNSSPGPATPTAAVPAPAPVHFIGRQPILDRAQQVFGYELLFRSRWENCFPGDPDRVGQQRIDTTLLFNIDNLVLGAKAFVNCTRDSLTSRYAACLPTGTVLEVPRNVAVDDELFAACQELKQQGYAIALDDYMPTTGNDRLLELADYIKVDSRLCGAIELSCLQSQLDSPNTALIAQKVEAAEEFQRALDSGYQYFQGYFFARPTVLPNREIPANPLAYIQLLSALDRQPRDPHDPHDPRDPRDFQEIERLVSSVAPLRLRLFRFVNSVDFGARDRISDVHQALLLIGDARFRKLVSRAAAVCLQTDVNQSPELLLLCLQRARFCELLAPIARQPPGEQYRIGLLSVIEALLNVPLEQVLKMLPLGPAAATALRGPAGPDGPDDPDGQAGPAGLPLRLVRHYEQSEWEACAALSKTLAISEADLTNLYLDSLRWANQQVHDAVL